MRALQSTEKVSKRGKHGQKKHGKTDRKSAQNIKTKNERCPQAWKRLTGRETRPDKVREGAGRGGQDPGQSCGVVKVLEAEEGGTIAGGDGPELDGGWRTGGDRAKRGETER